jgi:hypothetical protein
MSDEKYLAEFRHGESDLHLRALLWQRKILAERKEERRQMNRIASQAEIENGQAARNVKQEDEKPPR